MSFERRDDIVQTVAVDIIDSYRRATFADPSPASKGHRVVLLCRRGITCVRMFPPAVGSDDIDKLVAVYISDTNSVS